jgi:hypothetical protein
MHAAGGLRPSKNQLGFHEPDRRVFHQARTRNLHGAAWRNLDEHVRHYMCLISGEGSAVYFTVDYDASESDVAQN